MTSWKFRHVPGEIKELLLLLNNLILDIRYDRA